MNTARQILTARVRAMKPGDRIETPAHHGQLVSGIARELGVRLVARSVGSHVPAWMFWREPDAPRSAP